MNITIGTRGSALALWQAGHVASLLESMHDGLSVDLMKIKTKGDKILDAPLAKIGGKGLFTKEIEDALLDGRVDLAVHSMKDLPTELPEGLKLGAILVREDPRDVFISGDGRTPDQLGPNERVGTSSLRRKAFLLSRFKDLDVVSIRGNVDTRLRKIETEKLAGVLLAGAGVKRLGYGDRITTFLGPPDMLPAIGQGALGVEVRENDPVIEDLIRDLNHEETAACVKAERAFLLRMGGGCQVPMAAYASIADGIMTMEAAVVHPDGTPMMRERGEGPPNDPSLGTRLADALIARGADAVLREIQGEEWEVGPATGIV